MYRLRMEACLLLGAALLAGCSDRNTPTAPSVGPLAATAALVDRAYTWSLSCGGLSGGHLDYAYLEARWFWTASGDSIAGSGVSRICGPSSKVSGTGTRPGSANGFHACVGYTGCQSWTFDPGQPFSAQLKGSATFADPTTGCPISPKCKILTLTGTLRVDS